MHTMPACSGEHSGPSGGGDGRRHPLAQQRTSLADPGRATAPAPPPRRPRHARSVLRGRDVFASGQASTAGLRPPLPPFHVRGRGHTTLALSGDTVPVPLPPQHAPSTPAWRSCSQFRRHALRKNSGRESWRSRDGWCNSLAALNVAAALGAVVLWCMFAAIANPGLWRAVDKHVGLSRWNGAAAREECRGLVGNIVSPYRHATWHRLQCDSVLRLDGRVLLDAVAARPPHERLVPGAPTAALAHHDAGSGSDTAPVVIAVVTATASSSRVTRVEQLALTRSLLPSLAVTAEPGFEYWVYVAYDAGDSFLDAAVGMAAGGGVGLSLLGAAVGRTGADVLRAWFRKNVQSALAQRGVACELVLLRHVPGAGAAHQPAPAFNFALRAAYEDGADYMYRVNDDTWMATAWARPMVSALRNMEPPNLGVVGPWCDTGDPRLLEHDMTHRTHMAVFGAHYYPPVLGAQWLDEWVTAVYGGVPLSQQHPLDTGASATAAIANKGSQSRMGASSGVSYRRTTAPPTPSSGGGGVTGRRPSAGQRTRGLAPTPSMTGGPSGMVDASAAEPVTQHRESPAVAVRDHEPFVVPSRARKLRSVVVVHDTKADRRRFQVSPLPHGRRVVEYSVVDGLDTLLQWLRRQQALRADDPRTSGDGEHVHATAAVASAAGVGGVTEAGAPQSMAAAAAPNTPLARQIQRAVQDLGVARHVAKVHMHKRMHCGTDGLHCSAARARAAATGGTTLAGGTGVAGEAVARSGTPPTALSPPMQTSS